MATTTTPSSLSSPPEAVVGMSEADVILPPPSLYNPIPSLPAALRLDNQEQLLRLLLDDPSGGIGGGSGVFRQWLVFGTDSLRTLLLRQVLNDPHTATNKNKKKNWDMHRSFSFPRVLQPTIVGTSVLKLPTIVKTKTNNNINNNNNSNNPFSDDYDYSNSEEELGLRQQHVDVITYFLRPWDVEQTQAVARRIQQTSSSDPSSSSSNPQSSGYYSKASSSSSSSLANCHHRIVYIPQPTALVSQVLADLGMTNAAMSSTSASSTSTTTTTTSSSSSSSFSKVSIHSLQLDLFPLEHDIISMEYDDAMREREGCEGTPSNMISTCARAILKLQDIVGAIPRIQSLGRCGEDVLQKVLNHTVDEHLAREEEELGGGGGGSSAAVVAVEDEYHGLVPDNNTAMIMLDRKIDLITPMVTPLTYEGLLDEVVGIDCGFIHVPVSTINPDDDDDDENNSADASSNNPFDDGESNTDMMTKKKKKKDEMVVLGVHAGDTLFAEVRDQHVEKFGSFLQNQAMALKESHANFTNKGTKKDLMEIHQFVKQIPVRGGSFSWKALNTPLTNFCFACLLACCLLLLFLPLFATGVYTKSSQFDESYTPGRTHQGHNRTNLLS